MIDPQSSRIFPIFRKTCTIGDEYARRRNEATSFGGSAVGRGLVDVHAPDASLSETVLGILAQGEAMLKTVAHAAQRPNAVKYAAAEVKLLPPVPDPAKIVCIGLNYRDHAAEGGVPVPKDP